MASVNLFTVQDAVDHTIDFMGANVDEMALRDARRAVQNAYRELTMAHRWTIYYQRGRLNTVASQSTGTVEYDHTGGTYERMLTLSGATWPSWALYGVVIINNVVYQISDVKTSTVVILSSNSNPGADVAAGTSYITYRDTYTLPADFREMDRLLNMTSQLYPEFVHVSNWLQPQRLTTVPALPRRYTIMGDPNYMGALALAFFPAPDAAYPFDYIYQRRPRSISVATYKTGKVTGGISDTTLTGTGGTVWTSKLVGSIIRLSVDGTTLPTGSIGSNPFGTERVITAVGSTTSLTIDTPLTEAYTTVKYVISDPVDIEEGAMQTAFLRCCEKQVAITRKQNSKVDYVELYKQALEEARSADSRSFARRRAGYGAPYIQRLAYMPRAADIS